MSVGKTFYGIVKIKVFNIIYIRISEIENSIVSEGKLTIDKNAMFLWGTFKIDSLKKKNGFVTRVLIEKRNLKVGIGTPKYREKSKSWSESFWSSSLNLQSLKIDPLDIFLANLDFSGYVDAKRLYEKLS